MALKRVPNNLNKDQDNKNPLLKPFYKKLEQIQEDLLLGNNPDCPEYRESFYFGFDPEDVNDKSSFDVIDRVNRFTGFINDGSLEKHINESDIQECLEYVMRYSVNPRSPLHKDEFIKCLIEASHLGMSLSLKESGSTLIEASGLRKHGFSVRPNLTFSHITPDCIAIHGDEWMEDSNGDRETFPIKGIIPVGYNKTIEEKFLKSEPLRLYFRQYTPDWVHSGNDEIMYIESKKDFTYNPYLSSVGLKKFENFLEHRPGWRNRLYDDVENNLHLAHDERDEFRKWLEYPDISAFLGVCRSSADTEALLNCFESVKENLSEIYSKLDVSDIQDSLVVLSRKGMLEHKDDCLMFNGDCLKIQCTGEMEISFISNDKVVLKHALSYPLFENSRDSKPCEISLNGVTIDTSKFADNVFYQSVRYNYNKVQKRKEEFIDVMLGDDLKKKDAVKMALHFLQQYVGPSDVLEVSKKETDFDYSTDLHDEKYNMDKGTLIELFSRLSENSNLGLVNDDKGIGRINFKFDKKSCEVWFHEYSEGYHYFKIFKFTSEKELFPKIDVNIRDKYQCKLDKRERIRRNNYGKSW